MGAMTIGSIGSYGKNLNFTDISYFSVSRIRNIDGFTAFANKVHYVDTAKPLLYTAHLDPKAPYPDLALRGLKEPDFSADRWKYIPKLSIFTASTLTPLSKPAGSIAFVDGTHLRLRFVNLAKKSEWATAKIAYQKLRPPADSRGEPPRHEVAATRSSFWHALKALAQDRKPIISGLTEWSSSKAGAFGDSKAKNASQTVRFFAATRAKGFPLVTVHCQLQARSYCSFDRHCWLPKEIGSSFIPTGISFQKSSRLLLISGRRTIYKVRVKSCFDMRLVGKLQAPKKIADITDIHVDEHDRLWLSTNNIDNYHAANIYAWPQAAW